MDYRCQYCGRKLDTGLRCEVCDAKRNTGEVKKMTTPTKEQIDKQYVCDDCKYYFHIKCTKGGVCNCLPKREQTDQLRFACSLFKIRED